MRSAAYTIGSLLLIAFWGGCYYDKYEHFNPVVACDSIPVLGFSLHVKEVFDRHCNTCHASSAPSGGVTLDSYEGARVAAQSGKLLSAVTWDGGASFMPKNATQKIDECSIRKIKRWIDEGHPK